MTPAESNPPTPLLMTDPAVTISGGLTNDPPVSDNAITDAVLVTDAQDDGVNYDGGQKEALEQDQKFAELEVHPNNEMVEQTPSEPAKPKLMRSMVKEPIPDKVAESEKMLAELEEQEVQDPQSQAVGPVLGQGLRESNDPKTLLHWGTILFQSGVFPIVKSPQDAVARILMARSLQIDEVKAMYMLHMIDGKPVLSADLMRFLLDRAGVRYKVLNNREVFANPGLVTNQYPNGGAPDWYTKIRMKEDATGKDVVWEIWWSDCAPFIKTNEKTWTKFPKDMQLHACMRKCARFYFPAILGGVYDPDEMGLEDSHHTFAEEAK